MALTYPYPLAAFSDLLDPRSVQVALQRFDEESGGGDGRIWSSEMAPPLWGATLELNSRRYGAASELEARIDGLDGSRGTFLFADPTYRGPAAGQTNDLDSASVNVIRADRGAIGLAGVPTGFRISARDRFCIRYADGRVFFGRFIEGAVANGSGVIVQREIRPFLPRGIIVGAQVELVKPYFRAIIPKGGYTPFTFVNGFIAAGASLTLIQKP